MKKLLIILMVCLLFFTMTGMDVQTEIPEWSREDTLSAFDFWIDTYKDSAPQLADYYAKWRDVEIPNPIPREWLNADGTIAEGVTADMLNQKLHGSLLEEFLIGCPPAFGQYTQFVFYVIDEDGYASLQECTPEVGTEADYDFIVTNIESVVNQYQFGG